MRLPLPQRHVRHCLSDAVTLLTALFLLTRCEASDRIDGRYSFSLTTFDRSGRLGQVERATEAAALGTPVVAVCRKNGVIFACPQGFPSPLVSDDGTSRFSSITPHIACTHSGVGADGRVVLAAAQKLAIEHAYTFDEVIPIEIFLEELSLLFQEYTMKAGSRPFGCELLVAYVPPTTRSDIQYERPQLFRIDPSGAVESVTTYTILGSLQGSSEMAQVLEELACDTSCSSDDEPLVERDEEISESDVQALLKAMQNVLQTEEKLRKRESLSPKLLRIARMPFLTASITREQGLVVRRHDDPKAT